MFINVEHFGFVLFVGRAFPQKFPQAKPFVNVAFPQRSYSEIALGHLKVILAVLIAADNNFAVIIYFSLINTLLNFYFFSASQPIEWFYASKDKFFQTLYLFNLPVDCKTDFFTLKCSILRFRQILVY